MKTLLDATVAERTVQAVALGTVALPPSPRWPRTARRHPASTRTGYTVRVHGGVWRTAVRLAQGDKSRIEIISWDEVIVHNPGWGK